jgi:hypothetical protein
MAGGFPTESDNANSLLEPRSEQIDARSPMSPEMPEAGRALARPASRHWRFGPKGPQITAN